MSLSSKVKEALLYFSGDLTGIPIVRDSTVIIFITAKRSHSNMPTATVTQIAVIQKYVDKLVRYRTKAQSSSILFTDPDCGFQLGEVMDHSKVLYMMP